MAKTDGTQDIPSELLDGYRATLGEERPDKGVRKRYPYRVPTMQTLVGHPSPKQKAQRARFITAKNNFANVDWATRQRWYAAMPEYGSFLWYYNYFIMSSLGGNANIPEGGAGVIKSIRVIKESVPTTGGKTYTLDPVVDATKTVVMVYGSARKVPRIIRGSGSVADPGPTQFALGATVDPDKCTVVLHGGSYRGVGDSGVPIFPYIDALTTTHITIGWSMNPAAAGLVSWEVIEHVEGAVWPTLVSISNNEVVVDWAEEPDAAADVAILVIEYI